MPAKCRSCKAEIEWVVMPSGKRMPVDAKAKTMILVYHDRDGFNGETVQVHESHFATCPNAEEHRGA